MIPAERERERFLYLVTLKTQYSKDDLSILRMSGQGGYTNGAITAFVGVAGL